MKIAVVGLGSIGGIAAGALFAAGRHEVTVCVRRPIEGLKVDHGDETIEASVRVLADPEEAEVHDWVLLCTKTQDGPTAAPWFRGLCGEGTRVATLQNGMGHVERLAPLVAPARVVPTIVYFNGERFAPGHMRYRRAGDYDLAVGTDPDSKDFVALLEGTMFRILQEPDFKTLAWRKLLLNAVANPVTALTLQRQAVFRRTDIQALCLDILREAAAVGRADGANLADDEPERTLAALLTYPPEAGTSMLFDRLAKRPMETEALTGAIVAAGRRLGVPTPLNGTLCTLLLASD